MTAQRPTILLVDDSQPVLDGLRRMLRATARDWNLVFACGPEQALTVMREQRADIIVSDIRMPNMDGAALLRRVRDLYPDTVRLVLSGHADREDIIRSVGPIHQFLSKPCEGAALKTALSRVMHLRSVMNQPTLRIVATGLECLPPMPEVYKRLLDELDRPDATAATVGQIVAQDVAMTAKILQLVNSAFFGAARSIRTAQEAVARLGLNTIRGIVVAMRLFEQVPSVELAAFSMSAMWQRAMAVSERCRREAQGLGLSSESCSNAALAGMLHEVGRLALAVQTPGRYGDVIAMAAAGGEPLETHEERAFGATHGELGGYLLGLWGFGQSVVDAVAFHARPIRSADGGVSCLTALHLATSSESVEPMWRVSRDEGYLEAVRAGTAAA